MKNHPSDRSPLLALEQIETSEKPGREKLRGVFVHCFSVAAFKSNGKIKNLTGGLFLGNSNNPKPLEFSKSKKLKPHEIATSAMSSKSFFNFR